MNDTARRAFVSKIVTHDFNNIMSTSMRGIAAG